MKTTVEPGQYAVYDYKLSPVPTSFNYEPLVYISEIEAGVATVHLNNREQFTCPVDHLRPFVLVMRGAESE
ncbi:MAG: hypothetical protein JNJ61_25660 [Anaerolineae bacterium]|nr:hypothetical protein [Anaerolineae bacterium]